jgi:AraC-like DNA-binding protein
MNETPLIHHDKSLFLPLIEQLLDRKDWPVAFSSDSPTSEYTHPCIRLVVVNKNKAHIKLSRAFKYYQYIANPGEMAVIFPSGHFNHWAVKQEHSTFQCIFWETHVRLLYGGEDCVYWYHTFAPISSCGYLSLQALSQMSPKDQNRPQTLHLLKTIYHILYDQLLSDVPHTITQAMETYHSIQEYLSGNYHSSMTNRESVARALNLSPQHVSRLFKEFGDEGFNSRLKKLRLDYALNLLSQNKLSLDEIAARSGFTSTGYFIREFRKTLGFTPGAYRHQRNSSKR